MSDHKSYDDYLDLHGDGRIILYKRKKLGNQIWNTRLKIPQTKGYVIRSCRTTDEYAARRFAEDLYYELEGKSRRGEVIQSPSFADVFGEWKKDYPIEMRGRTQQYIDGNIRRGELYLAPFFGKTSMDQINERLMSSYFLNRRSSENGSPPENVTLRHEATVLRHILRYARTKGYIPAVPPIPQPKMKVNPRPDIPRQEWRKLYTYLRTYVSQSQDKRRYRERLYLQNWILILANTGMRVGELRRVRWRDVSQVSTIDGESRLSFRVVGKTGERVVISNRGVEEYVSRLWKFRTEEKGMTKNKGDKPSLDEFVMCSRDGKPIGSFKKGFERVLTECGVLYDGNGKKRVPYSLRHTYATMRISEGVNVYQLASNMGTSVDMIEMYYGKKRNTGPRNVSEVTKITTPRGTPVKSDDDNPFWLS